jgi:hypothetical protein
LVVEVAHCWIGGVGVCGMGVLEVVVGWAGCG